MSNRLVEAFRRDLASRGQVDPRDDDYLTLELGRAAEQNNRDLFDQFGDFAEEYRNLREANAPTLTEEAGRALKSGTQGLASTALGGLGLITGSDYLKGKARSFDEDAAANAPTIPTLEDIAPGETAAGKTFSRDALRYGIAKVGSVAPSIAESVVVAGAGAALGSAMAPGPGTVAGAVGGVLEKSLVKAAIRRLLAKGVVNASAEQIAAEAAAVGAFRGGVAANAAGSLLLNTGDVASEGADTATTLALGVVSALPDTILPAYVLKKLFPGVAKKAAVEAGKTWLARHGTKIAELSGVPASEFGQEYFQEAVNVVAKNIKEGNDPLKFDEADFRRLREAGIAGAAGGLLAAPGVMLSGREGAQVTTAKPTAEATRRAMAEAALAPPTSPSVGPTSPSTVSPAVLSPARRVSRMTDEQKQARLAELSALPTPSPLDQQELELLRAIVGSEPAAPAPPIPAPFVSTATTGATGVSPPLETLAASAPVAATPSSWSDDELKRRTETWRRTFGDSILERVEELAAQRKVASEIGAELGKDPEVVAALKRYNDANPGDIPEKLKDVARDVRSFLGIPSLQAGEEARDFETWLTARKEAKSKNQLLAPAPVSPAVETATDPRAKYPDVFADAPEGQIPVEIQRADGSVYPAVVNGFYDLRDETGKGEVRASVGRKLAEGWSHGMLNNGETILTPIPTPEQWAQGIREVKTSGATLSAPAPAAVTDVTPNAVAGAAPSVEETPSAPAPVVPAITPAPVDVAGAGAELVTADSIRIKPGAVVALSRYGSTYEDTPTLSFRSGSKLSEIIDAPALFAAHPELADIKVFRRKFVEGDSSFANGNIYIVEDTSGEKQVEHLMHEVQHAIQRAQGREAGTTSTDKTRAEYLKHPSEVEARGTIAESKKIWQAASNMFLGAGAAPVPVAPSPENRVVPELSNVPPVQQSQTLEERLRTELAKPEPFHFGSIDESSAMTTDVREDAIFDALTPETAATFRVPEALGEGGNASQTRIAVVLETTDGRYVVAGLLRPQEMAKAGATGEKATGTAVQLMATHVGGPKSIKEGGKAPALLADVVAAGYKVRAFIHFDAAPGKIFERFPTRAAYDAAFGATKKTTGSQAAKTIPTRSASEGVARRNALEGRDTIQRQIDTLGAELGRADPARSAEINDEIQQHYADLSRLPEPRLATATETGVAGDLPLSVSADRATQFATVAARGRRAGMRVDVFAQTFLQAKLTVEYQRRLEGLIARYQTAPEAGQAALQRQIEHLQERLASIEGVQGVAYGPNHIAIGLDDVQNANLAGLITLIHEINHSLLQRDPAMHAKVIRAAQKLAIDLHGESRVRTERTGSGEAHINDDYEELLVHTFAQRLAEEGVPDSPSLARAIIQWVKDLYYRLAMGVQAAFGREPSPQMALDWFENQLRRLTGGDFDYRFANLFARLQPETTSSLAQRQNTIGGTPGGIADYYDPTTNTVRQPHVLPDSREAVEWNHRFATAPAVNPGEELDIPYPEAAERINAAAVNEMVALTDKMYAEAAGPVVEGQERLTFDQWWASVDDGDQPKIVLAEHEAKVPGAGTATIGGERMTEMMNSQARVRAKELLYHLRDRVVKRNVAIEENESAAEKTVNTEAKHVLKIEGDLRNSTMHEATFTDSFKEMVRDAIKGMRRGLDTAFAAGELNEAIHEAEEDLAERDPIPEEYQKVFRAILADGVPVFQYIEAIAKLDFDLAGMTRPEIIAGIRDNAHDEVLARLLDDKPLLTSIVALAKKNAQQVDMLQLRLADGPTYLKLKADMDDIRSASNARLKEMEKVFKGGKKAATYTDRIKRRMVASRAKLRKAVATIQESADNRDLLTQVTAGLTEKIEEMETNGLPAPSEWKPSDGAKYPAMYQNEDGAWRSRERTLEFTREGPAVNAAQVAADMVQNRQYIRENPKKKGSKNYELVQRVGLEIGRLDVFQTYPELRRLFIEKWFLPSSDQLLSGGGAGAARIAQMLKRFQGITFRNWHKDVEIPSLNYVATWKRAAKSAGFDDINHFQSQVVEPALYLIGTEPGRDLGPALREGVRIARKHLTAEPGPNFDDNFKSLLLAIKERSEFNLHQVAEKEGLAIEDKRLGGELRKAVPRGAITVIRRINAAAAGTVLTDMDAAGWKAEFQDADKKPVNNERFDQAVGRGRKIVGAASFNALFPDGTSEEADAAKVAVLEDPAAFAQAISGFFTPGIIRRFLAPFINKPGKPVFSHAGEQIDQLELQTAWIESGGDVTKWIDLLGQRVGLELDVELGDEMTPGNLSLEAQWRLSTLKQLDSLFLMVSRIAADSRQTTNLFDPTGRPVHLMMDARENELLPSEFVQHMTFDLVNSRNLLSTLAFHAAFGRNGEAMNRALDEVKSGLQARKNAYQTVVSQRSTKADRQSYAKELGFDYKEIKEGAEIFDHMMQSMDLLKAQFGFGTPAGVLGDVRGALELLHFTATQMTNNVKTGLLNLLQPAQRALTRRSLGPGVMRDTAGAYGGIAYGFFGGVLEKVGLHILRSSEHAKLVGALNGQGIGDVSPSVLMGIAVGKRGEELPTAIKAMRGMNALQQRGFGARQHEFQRAKIIPFVENTMAGLGMTAAIANGAQEAVTIERVVKAAMDYYTSHPDDAANPAHRLTAENLGMANYGWFGNRGDFDYYVRKLPEYGLGTLEKLAHDGMDRATRAEPILDEEQVGKAAQIAGNELDFQGSINTNPASWGTNSFLKFATPLLGWPIRQMNAVHQAMREADGRGSALAAVRAIGILAAWTLPMGLAFTFLTDEYDDKILKKKSNLGRLPGVAGVPIVGPLIGLATSDISPMEQAKSILKRISRANNIYGLGSDFASSVLSGLDPTSGARPFSLDSRILAFSQLRTIADAMNSFISSGGAVTWTTVERPLIQAMGGNGALSALDIINAALGLDNAQSRAVARTNLQQWIRTAGSEVGLELRRSGGASVAPTPVSVWVREMNFAAISNDRLLFLSNWRKAVDAAREEGDPDPEAAVLRSWKGRDPLDVLKVKPTEGQIARMMSVMDDTGRATIRDGLRLFQQYTDLIAPSPAERYQKQQLGQLRRGMNAMTPESLRRTMANQSLSFR